METADGPVPIEDIEVGDRVWAFDEETGETALHEVARTFTREAAQILAVSLLVDDGPDPDSEPDRLTVRATEEHPFWVVGEGWSAANHLEPGDIVRTLPEDDHDATVDSVALVDQPTTVYNFEVSGARTYFVSDQQMLVHNVCNPKQIDHFRRIYEQGGKSALEKSRKSLEKQISKHTDNMASYSAEGGHVSSIQRELTNFRNELEAIEHVMRDLE